jgi:hypothetical protein
MIANHYTRDAYADIVVFLCYLCYNINMDKFPRSDESPLPSSEQREVALDERDILDLHHDLLEAAENLNAFATPGKHERTAIRIPLDNEVLNQTTAGKWQFYTSLSAAYFKDDDIESLGMTFTTPQVYDSIDVRLAAENYWNVTPNGMSGPITSFRNEQLLRLIDAKTAHNTGTIDLIRRLPTLRAGEFPAALMDMLEPLAKINTDIRTYSASDYVISSSSQVESGRVVPEFMSRSTADIALKQLIISFVLVSMAYLCNLNTRIKTETL